MDICDDTSKSRTLKMEGQAIHDRYKNAMQSMIFFRNDRRLYIFWRNVYKRYRDSAWKQQGLFQANRKYDERNR
ncbi:MAG: hypothetical protein ACTTH7_09085 [Treponema sp.]